jgi:uncharacterized protein YbbC (DUF1343 family)
VRLLVLDPSQLSLGKAQLVLTHVMAAQFGDALFDTEAARVAMFDKAMGSDLARMTLQSGAPLRDLLDRMKKDCSAFRALRGPYLIY